MSVLYGIRQCDTCRKTLKWLEQQGIEHRFHDLRTDGLDAEMIERWLTQLPLSTLINRRSTTWRTLDGTDQQRLNDGDWRELLQAHPTLIKRPLLQHEGTLFIGMGDIQAADLSVGEPA